MQQFVTFDPCYDCLGCPLWVTYLTLPVIPQPTSQTVGKPKLQNSVALANFPATLMEVSKKWLDD